MKKSRRKKLLYTLLVLALSGAAGALVWQRLTDANEPALDIAYYPAELDSIQTTRKTLAKEKADLKKIRKHFVAQITGKIFPYWYGTKWDFNGTTETPREGKIACGYFVTTTLRDAGIPINRVKMAQCASEEMIRSLVSKKHIHHLSGIPLAEFENKLKKLGEGLYVIGLDHHTGFIWLSPHGNFFIHSSGWFPFKVIRETLSDSKVLARSKYRVVGKISDDEGFLRSWIGGR